MDKQSDCGEFNLLKCEYQVLKLKEIATIKARIGWQGLKQEEHLEQGDYYLITGTDFVNGSIDFERCKFISKERYIQDKNIQIKNGDILVTKDGTLGKVAYVEGLNKPATLNSGVFVIRVNENKVLSKYLFQYLSSNKLMNFVRRRSIGGTIQHLNQSVIVEFPILFPSIDNQNKIITILSTQDKVIELKEKLLKEKQKQKKYLMQNILTGRKRLKGFNGEWNIFELKNVLRERKTYSIKGTEYPHVTLSKDGIYEKNERYDRDHLVKTQDKKYKITLLNDICYNPANLKFGVICINKYGSGIFSPIYITFEVEKNFDVGFISHYLTRWDFINSVRKYEEGTVYERTAVKPQDFLKYKIKLPSLEEQKAIAEILTTADRELKLLREELGEEERKKKALMQLLLTGVVKVK